MQTSPCQQIVPAPLPLALVLDAIEKRQRQLLRPNYTSQQIGLPRLPLSSVLKQGKTAVTKKIILKTPQAVPKDLQLPKQATRFVMAPYHQNQLRNLPGNDRCCDCGALHPEWASTTLSSLICLQCAGAHRSLGVNKSRVRSLYLDSWSNEQVVRMLAGGNGRLQAALHWGSASETGQPLSISAAGKLYASEAAAQYTRALDLKCRPELEIDDDQPPSFGDFMLHQMGRMKDQAKRVRKASVKFLSPCVSCVSPTQSNKNAFNCISSSFACLFRRFWSRGESVQTQA